MGNKNVEMKQEWGNDLCLPLEEYEEKGSDEIFIPFPLFATATMGLLFYEMYKRTLQRIESLVLVMYWSYVVFGYQLYHLYYVMCTLLC